MAIDFGRMFRNVATGYLSAKIANTEANDALNANIIERAGLNFYENTLPEWEAGEKVRKETYNKVYSVASEGLGKEERSTRFKKIKQDHL